DSKKPGDPTKLPRLSRSESHADCKIPSPIDRSSLVSVTPTTSAPNRTVRYGIGTVLCTHVRRQRNPPRAVGHAAGRRLAGAPARPHPAGAAARRVPPLQHERRGGVGEGVEGDALPPLR